MRFRWVQFHIEISKVTGPKFTGLVSPNAGGIVVDQVLDRFRISSSIPEIFAAKLRSRPKSGQILHFGGYDSTSRSLQLVDQSSPDFFAKRRRNWCRSNKLPIFIRSGDICRQTLKSSEIRPNFACFWSLKFFGVGPKKF